MLGHLISFRPDPERIVFWKQGEAGELLLLGKCLDIKFSDSVLCTGYQDLEKYSRCPHGMKGRKQCSHCKNLDVSKVYTRLDFEGYEAMKEEYVHQDFSIYLAQFGDAIIKCGVTRSERVEERTHEQGADFWVELLRFNNGEDAYAAENALQQRFNLRNAVWNSTKLELLGKKKTKTALEAKTKEIKNELEKGEQALVEMGGVFCESEIKENAYPVPPSFDVAYSIDGTITGSKAQMLFYEKEGKHFVVPMNENVGRVFLLKGPEGL
jgi:hypothetical protein